MSRSANPGPVHLSGVGDVCRPFWEDLGQEPSRPPAVFQARSHWRWGLCASVEVAPLPRDRPVCGQLGEQSFSSAASLLRAHREAHCTLPSPSCPW